MIKLMLRFFIIALLAFIAAATSGCTRKQRTPTQTCTQPTKHRTRAQKQKRTRSARHRTHKQKANFQAEVSPLPVHVQASVEERACLLCDKFVDIEKDDSLNWEQFAKGLAAILKEKECYASAGTALECLSSSTSPFYIGYKLRPLKKHFPKVLLDKLNTFSSRQLLDIISTRVNNKKSTTVDAQAVC